MAKERPSELSDTGAAQSPSGVRRRSSRSMRKVAPGTVLIVDDDEQVRASMERMVTAHGWDAISTHDPHVALALCTRETPDIVLSDFDMPGLRGDRLARLLRLTMGDRTPPIIIVTGNDPEEVSQESVQAVLSKPVESETLCATIERLLEGR